MLITQFLVEVSQPDITYADNSIARTDHAICSYNHTSCQSFYFGRLETYS